MSKMTKKLMEEKILTEILTCHQLKEDGEYENPRQHNATYQDGLIYALNIVRNQEDRNK